MFSSSQNALLKLFKTTSTQTLFPSDCITLYNTLRGPALIGLWTGADTGFFQGGGQGHQIDKITLV